MFFSLALAALDQPDLPSLLKQVDEQRLKATVQKLSSFTTRNTLSTGLVDACEWLAEEYRKIPGMKVEIMNYPIAKGRRIPEDMEAVQVVATLPGKTDRTVLLGGHIDSLNLEVDAKTGRAPGANDDASGVALCLEAARVAAQSKWNQTIQFVAFSGEEQGLYGSKAMAARAKAETMKLEAVLSSDTVGSSSNRSGQKDTKHVRVFSEEGEGHHSRELARIIEWSVRHSMKDFGVKLVLRRDRFGRGGDHTPFVAEGFNAVRFIEVHEEFTRQHTPDDIVEHMDFKYLAQVTRANLAALSGLANAAPAPTGVHVKLDQNHDTTIQWKGQPGVKYVVYWRDTASAAWQGSVEAGSEGSVVIKKVNKDDHIFAVGAVGGIPVVAS